MGWPFRVTPPLLHTLAALLDIDRRTHGWEIAARASQAPPNVYRVLERLHDVGWVEREWEQDRTDSHRPSRRMYWLTAVGRETAPHLLAERTTTPRTSDQTGEPLA